jgi:hypothetical protein
MVSLEINGQHIRHLLKNTGRKVIGLANISLTLVIVLEILLSHFQFPHLSQFVAPGSLMKSENMAAAMCYESSSRPCLKGPWPFKNVIVNGEKKLFRPTCLELLDNGS